jgi:alpha-beta hydrolase superfamily lysophospholipase
MKKSDVILKREQVHIRFKNEEMDFMFNWVLGMGEIVGLSHGEIFYAIAGIKDGDPTSWREGFRREGHYLRQRALGFEQEHRAAAGHSFLAAAYAYRASLQYADPTETSFPARVSEMEEAFGRGTALLDVPLRAIEVPFEGGTLPGYYLEQDPPARPTVLMIGGGDTFREDLFYFAGYPGWQRGYNVLMVDLPGQGKTPAQGLHFQVDAAKPIAAALDWLESHAPIPPQQIAIYGISGGGYFSAQAVVADPRLQAWIASTPIVDMAQVFEREMGGTVKTPGWFLKTVMRLEGAVNASAELNLKKYAWQFGTSDFKQFYESVLHQAIPVDYGRISCPALLLMGESEGAELKRQTQVVYEALHARGQDVTLHEFVKEDGADAHCQVNNLRFAHLVIFDWLDRVFSEKQMEPGTSA